MKRQFFVLLILVFSCIIAQAQSDWEKVEFEADELKGQEAYTAFVYKDEDGNKLTMWSNEDDYFRITSGSHIFNYEIYGSDKYFVATVGFYDENNNLVEKINMFFIPKDDNSRIAHNNVFMSKNKKKGKKVIQYLKNDEGFVRILAPLYNSVSEFDLRIPCIKTAEKNKQAKTPSIYETIYNGVEVIMRKVSIVSLYDSTAIYNYNRKIDEWINNHQELSIEKDNDSINANHIVLHVNQSITPKWEIITWGKAKADLAYDVAIDIDANNHGGIWFVDNIQYMFSIYDSIDNTIPKSVIDEIITELEIIVDICEDKDCTMFTINDSFLQHVKNAQDNSEKMRKYLELYGSLLINYSSIFIDFPLYP